MLAAGDTPAGVVALAFAFQREAEGIDEQFAALRRVGGNDRHARDKENVHAAQPTALNRGRGYAEYGGSPADSALSGFANTGPIASRPRSQEIERVTAATSAEGSPFRVSDQAMRSRGLRSTIRNDPR